ncbi:hypothetical protein AGMMS49992_09390 [Clostridia bacterium]|nr:hypothetical protein AGMMS49992_09390 [Clostridia bacterium]
MGIFPEDWVKQFDKTAPMYAATMGMDLSCGIVSGRAVVRRTDTGRPTLSLMWLLSGTGRYKATTDEGEVSCPLTEGSLLLRRPDHPDTLTLNAHECQRRCFISLDPTLMPILFSLTPELNTVCPVTEKAFDQTLFDKFVAFIQMVDQMDATRPLSYMGALWSLICALYGWHEDVEEEDQILRAARLIMTEPISVTLPEIAARCGMAYTTFRKRFIAVIGQTPGNWRIEQRLERAKQELAAGELIVDIADHLSYSDVFSFTHQFRKWTGMTPKKYQVHNIL